MNEYEMDMQLVSGNSHRIHSVSHAGLRSVVAVKVFEGPHAKQVLIFPYSIKLRWSI